MLGWAGCQCSCSLQAKLDDYGAIRCINYIRAAVKAGRDPRPELAAALSGGAQPWDKDQFLFPVLQDDSLLCHEFGGPGAPAAEDRCAQSCMNVWITPIQPSGLMKMKLTHHQEHHQGHQAPQNNPSCSVPPPRCYASCGVRHAAGQDPLGVTGG